AGFCPAPLQSETRGLSQRHQGPRPTNLSRSGAEVDGRLERSDLSLHLLRSQRKPIRWNLPVRIRAEHLRSETLGICDTGGVERLSMETRRRLGPADEGWTIGGVSAVRSARFCGDRLPGILQEGSAHGRSDDVHGAEALR